MGNIRIQDLELMLHIGVSDEERAKPQRVLVTLDLEHDFASAVATDRLTKTIDYFMVAQRLLKLGEGRSWKLVEKLANDIAELVIAEFQPGEVTVEVKKFAIPQAQYVSVRLSKTRAGMGIKRAAWGIP